MNLIYMFLEQVDLPTVTTRSDFYSGLIHSVLHVFQKYKELIYRPRDTANQKAVRSVWILLIKRKPQEKHLVRIIYLLKCVKKWILQNWQPTKILYMSAVRGY